MKKNRIKKNTKNHIFGIDEAGRGPLAGPVVAAAVWVNNKYVEGINPKTLKDSKQISEKKREEIYEILKSNPQVRFKTGRVGNRTIDRINIFEATKLAMKRAVKNLEKDSNIRADQLKIDGNFGIDMEIPQTSYIRGDERIYIIKLASIVAKVTRDRYMYKCHKKYPNYRFDKHKGYGTKLHKELIKEHGASKLHRKSFRLS